MKRSRMTEKSGPNYGLMIRYTLRAFTRVLQTVAASRHITAAEFRILRTLGEEKAVTQAELANLAAMDRPYAAAIVKRLHAHGLVKRAPNKGDRRRIDLLLTKRGSSLLADVSAELEKANRRAAAGIRGADLRVMIDVLDRMKQNLGTYELPGGSER
jgi:MarR family transcriptional regulator, organic hydroperoxide resistance regulator